MNEIKDATLYETYLFYQCYLFHSLLLSIHYLVVCTFYDGVQFDENQCTFETINVIIVITSV